MKLMSGKNWVRMMVGTFLCVLGINLFMVPHGLYTGGLTGISQLLRTLVADVFHVPLGSFDFAGIILYVFNIPIYFFAYRLIGKKFFFSSLICTTLLTVLFSVIPIPHPPLLGDDVLASSIVGGYISGYGIGLILLAGTSAGGSEMVGLMIIRKKSDFSVGKINLAMNLIVYLCCLLFFSVQVVVYSIIAAVASSLAIDRTHTQNINVEVKIVTKRFTQEMKEEILREMVRGITVIPAVGAYTGEKEDMLYILVSKYEVGRLYQLVTRYDPEAFFVTSEKASVHGNYLKKLEG